jgi:hypothetical protein
LADLALVDQAVQAEIAQVALADLAQVEIAQVVLVVRDQQVLAVDSPVQVHQEQLQVEHLAADQVDVLIQQAVAVIPRAHLENPEEDHLRVASQSGQNVKSSTT